MIFNSPLWLLKIFHLKCLLCLTFGSKALSVSLAADKKKREREEDYKIADVMSKEVEFY